MISVDPGCPVFPVAPVPPCRPTGPVDPATPFAPPLPDSHRIVPDVSCNIDAVVAPEVAIPDVNQQTRQYEMGWVQINIQINMTGNSKEWRKYRMG